MTDEARLATIEARLADTEMRLALLDGQLHASKILIMDLIAKLPQLDRQDLIFTIESRIGQLTAEFAQYSTVQAIKSNTGQRECLDMIMLMLTLYKQP